LYSTVKEKLGYDPLPKFEEPYESPLSKPEIAKEYPYILITGGRFLPYFHSEHRQVDSFRKKYPYPVVELNPSTAKENNIVEGDWVWIDTPRGRVMQKCKYDENIDPRVVHAQHGWWYPELPGEEPWLHGVWISNINVCTDDGLEHCDEAGSWPLRTMLCKVYKVKGYGEDRLPLTE
jgi:anaerobic selenocysteine-containing dehydrogenase